MTQLDEEIRRALSADDAQFLERFGAEQALHRQVMDTFRGAFGWLNALTWLLGFALFAVFAVCVWKFAAEPDLRAALAWGGGALLAFTGLATTKIWFWMELHRNAVVREVKRLELQLARQAAR